MRRSETDGVGRRPLEPREPPIPKPQRAELLPKVATASLSLRQVGDRKRRGRSSVKATVAAEQVAAGSVNYLTLFNAQQTYQTALINRVKAQGQRYSDTAALFQALGGGWWNRTDVDAASKGAPGVFDLPPAQDIKLPRGGQQGT